MVIFNYRMDKYLYTEEKGQEFLQKVAAIAAKMEGDKKRTFKVIISTDQVDRHGEVVLQSGIKTDHYMANPVVLWGHNHFEMPIGTCTSMYQENRDGKNVTIAEGYFARHEKAQACADLYDDGILKTTSIGFIAKERDGNVITESELLEFSFVSVPANPGALSELSAERIAVIKELGLVEEITEDEQETQEKEVIEEATEELIEDETEEAEPEDEETVKSLLVKLVESIEGLRTDIKTITNKEVETPEEDDTTLEQPTDEEVGERSEAEVEVEAAPEEDAKPTNEKEAMLYMRRNVQIVAGIVSKVLGDVRDVAEKNY